MKYTLEQMKENRRKWVEALRSGEYEQCTGRLHDGSGFCCLGVLCEVIGMKKKRIATEIYYFGNASEIAPLKAQRSVGLISRNGSFDYDNGNGSCLAEENDSGKSFSEIADIIESEPEGLFVE